MNQARITIQIQLRINNKLLLQQVAAERKDTKIADKLQQENVEIHESGTKIWIGFEEENCRIRI